MKKVNLLTTMGMLSLLLSSCSVIEGIFKAGMGFGIFLVVLVVAVIVVIALKLTKKS